MTNDQIIEEIQRLAAMLTPSSKSASGDIAAQSQSEPTGDIDPVDYWIGIPEEEWRAETVDVGPPDGKLWLTLKQTEEVVGRKATFVRALIRDYPIGLMYGGQWVVNRYRAIAAMRGRLPPKKKAEN